MDVSGGWERYDWPIDMDNDGDSRARVLRLVGDAHDVLELGASRGLMTQAMRDMGMAVTAVEVDPDAAALAAAFAARVVVADLDSPGALDGLPRAGYDLLLAADVLEHLRDPRRCLAEALPLLRPGGRVILSVPNVAHGDVRLALLGGRFPYHVSGLLDRTHIHFFTFESLVALLGATGLQPIAWHRTVRPIGETEVPVDPHLAAWGRRVLAGDREATTYQWIVECVPSSAVAAGRGEVVSPAAAVAEAVHRVTVPPVAETPLARARRLAGRVRMFRRR